MKETRKGNKAIQIIADMMFYGQYYENDFQVLYSATYTERKYKTWMKKYNF